MTDENKWLDMPAETIRKQLIVKKAKGNEYYYLRFRFGIGNVSFKDIEITYARSPLQNPN